MQDSDRAAGRRRAHEDEDDRQRDQALMDQMRRQSVIERERRIIGEAIGVSDADILVELQLAGYRGETIALLDLAPLLQLAWADGSVSADERDVILRIAARERIVHDSPAHITLQVALERRPSDEFFTTSLRGIHAMVSALQPDVGKSVRRRLLDNCTAVATASGGLFGVRTISEAKRVVLQHVTTALERADQVSRHA